MSQGPAESYYDSQGEENVVEFKFFRIDNRRLVVKQEKEENGHIVYKGFDLDDGKSVALSERCLKINDSDSTDMMKQWFDNKLKQDYSELYFGGEISHNQSTVEREYEYLDWVGEGGFGSVIKVKRKNEDKSVYAIKRVELRFTEKMNEGIKREVTILAKLYHKNVVRYGDHWIEPNSAEKYFKRNRPNSSNANKRGEYSGANEEGESSGRHEPLPKRRKSANQFLYIRMEYCDTTLRKLIDDGLAKDENRVWELFNQILDGVAYIHELKIIHRDLNPSNIFLDNNGNVKIGDFGLATTDVDYQSDDLSKKTYLTGGLDNELYLAPELTADNKYRYNNSVDIYSLGIILLEMLCSVKHKSLRERILLDARLKEIQLPESIKDPSVQRTLRFLLTHELAMRPSAKKLLIHLATFSQIRANLMELALNDFLLLK